MQTVTEECVRLLDRVRQELELSEEQFEVVDYKECFCFYHCNQEEKLQNHQAGLFDGSSDGMVYYGLEKEKTDETMCGYDRRKAAGHAGG